MTKTNIAPGREFKFGNLPCIVLEEFENDTVLVLSKESIGDKAFDEDNCNNFNKSSLRQFLNDDFLEALAEGGADLDSMLDFTIDLTSDDGLKDYGESTNRVALLTCDMYRKYRSIIPNLDGWWWLATAYSTESNGWAHLARYVDTDGSLSYSGASYGGIGVRPAFLLKSSIFESCHPDLRHSLRKTSCRRCLDEMPTVISLKDGKVETLFAERDFEYLIDKYMGFDVVRYFRELVQDYEERIEEAQVNHDNE